ncbi:uncharacterized protein K02A2.6-like [Topomyia yanbarensis]|uniref:uncharacterized protein K02A2.6-like n=1 Tax=Topomyia yanbarensis TaxID=2498891 RepID=UPI00273AE4EB|nr:uncharacterized protein K02A2.6-like [Topomyia yanbarensis]
MDMLGPLPSGESILVLIDLYSRFRITEVVIKTTTEDIIEKLKQNFLRMGIPAILISDNARNFSSQKMQNFCTEFGIQLKHTTPYWPQANGEVERQNRSILKALRIAEVNGTDWKDDLQEANYVYSIIQHPATGRTPAELVFGRRLRDWIPEVGHFTNGEHEEIMDHDKIYRYSSKGRYDLAHGCKDSSLEPNDRVLMRNLMPQNKLAPLYNPIPATVIEKQGNSVIIETEDGKRFKRNSAHLKKLSTSGELEQQQPSDGSTTDWGTPSSPATGSSTPIVAAEQIDGADNRGRPRREIKRPLRFDDFEVDI